MMRTLDYVEFSHIEQVLEAMQKDLNYIHIGAYPY